jgi:hypothetical protein
MSVYVDQLVTRAKPWAWEQRQSCHMIADSEEELHAFARKLGMSRSWFHDQSRWPHYDLTPSRRISALQKGAQVITTRELLTKLQSQYPDQ